MLQLEITIHKPTYMLTDTINFHITGNPTRLSTANPTICLRTRSDLELDAARFQRLAVARRRLPDGRRRFLSLDPAGLSAVVIDSIRMEERRKIEHRLAAWIGSPAEIDGEPKWKQMSMKTTAGMPTSSHCYWKQISR